MFTAWTSHLRDPEEKTRFQNQVQSAKPVLDRLLEMVKQRDVAIDSIEYGVKQYEVPNWEFRQAHFNGGKGERSWFKTIIDLEKQETPNDRKPTRPHYTTTDSGPQ